MLSEDIKTAIYATHPIVYVKTDDETEVIDTINNLSEDYIFLTFDMVDNLKWINQEKCSIISALEKKKFKSFLSAGKDFESALKFVREYARKYKIVIAVLSANVFIDTERNPDAWKNIRILKNITNGVKAKEVISTVFLISGNLVVPSELEKDILVFETSYPDRERIRNVLGKFLKDNDFTLPDDLKNKFISALQGLSESEIDNLLHLAYGRNNQLDESDVDFFIDYKKQIVKKNAIIEYVDLRRMPAKIGGLKTLKKWLNRKKEIFSNIDKAYSFGVDIPKGMLLFGMPGCGKSLTAKYTAKLLDLPLLRLDMGRIMGPYLGQSEENMRKAIKIAESIAPSVLWIDEIEKALAGVGGGGSETTVRIFGTLLTWMQEKTHPVFVVATANKIEGIPPEFLRKGRFDEIFFVDFPDKESIKEIFKIHLKKRKKASSIQHIDFDTIINKMESGYSGADIEAIVVEAVERAFLNKKGTITTDDILKIIDEGIIKPISRVLKEQIEQMKEACEKISAKRVN